MRWPTLVTACAILLALGGCDKIPLLSKKPARPDTMVSSVPAARAPADTMTPPAQQPPAPAAQQPPREATRPPAAPVAASDEPWTPVDTGTVNPGMSRNDVIATWGPPVAERTVDGRDYLYFRNGCEYSCGTFDVVFLENDQVVDAIVRGPGHNYSGQSSSPRDRKGELTLPARVPGPETGQST